MRSACTATPPSAAPASRNPSRWAPPSIPSWSSRLFTMTAHEARLRGTHQALTPVVDVARDPRWGRVEETYGEDPFLVSRMGIAAVRGFQGDATFRDKTRVIATLKHFAAHGQPESGMNCAPANVSVRVLRETFLFPFKAGDPEGRRHQRDGLLQRNRRRAVPCQPLAAARRAAQGMGLQRLRRLRLLRHLGTGYRPETHGHFVAKDKKEACALAVQAGVNIELPEPDCYLHLVELVRKGVLKEKRARRTGRAHAALEIPAWGCSTIPTWIPTKPTAWWAATRIAGSRLQAARRVITLLKNDGGLAPLDRSVPQTIAVIGPNANRCLLGGYSGVAKHEVTMLDGIKAKAGTARQSALQRRLQDHAAGGSWQQDEVVASDPAEDRKQIAEAVKVAQQGRRGRARHRRQRADFARSLDPDPHGRPRQSGPGRPAGGTGATPWPPPASRSSSFSSMAGPLPSSPWSRRFPPIFECWYLGQETGTRRRGGSVRRLQPWREAAHHHSALGRPSARLLQLQAVRAPRLSVRRCDAALPLRLRLELHHLQHRERAPLEEPHGFEGKGGSARRCHQHRTLRRERSGADVHPRSGQLGDTAGEGAEGIPQSGAGSRAKPPRSSSRSPRICWSSGTSI